jgi:hypothetical protein
VSFPDEDAAEIRRLARETGLAQQDVIRQSSKLGRPLLRQQLSGAGRITNVDPLPAAVLKQLYDEREDDTAAIREMIQAQSLPS